MNRLRKLGLVLVLALLFVLLLGCIANAAPAKLHPGMLTIRGGQSVGDGSYINHNDSGYPFIMTFELDEETIPLESCRLGINSWDCDWDERQHWNHEHDIVYVNGHSVGVLTGTNNTWKTSYFSVPVNCLRIGQNTITIHVGHKDNSTGAVTEHSDDWLLTVKQAVMQFDGGKDESSPDSFDLRLSYASRTENGISCGATATIQSKETHSYTIEYSLLDFSTPSSFSYGNIISEDSATVTGSSVQSTGHFFLRSDAPYGTYRIEATLRDPVTGQVLAYDQYEFDLGDALEGSCDHKGTIEDVFERTEYYLLDKKDANYNSLHRAIDDYYNICSECERKFYIYKNERTEGHSLPVCPCGYVQEGYNPIHSATLSPVDKPYVNEDFVVTVVTHEMVKRISAVNNNNYPMADTWSRQSNGDGTVTWTRIYTASSPSGRRSWTISAFNHNNRKIGTATTNAIAITNEKDKDEEQNAQQTVKTFTLKVVDEQTGKAISGASVVLCGKSGSTKADGTLVFQLDDLQGSGLVVSKSPYQQTSISQYQPRRDGGMDVIALTTAKECILPQMCNDDNIATGAAQINTKANLSARITISGQVGKNDSIEQYELLQGGTVLGASEDGHFTISNSKFSAGTPVTAKMTIKRANGKLVTIDKQLNIQVVSFGNDLAANLEIPLLDGFDLGLKGIDLVNGLNMGLKKSSHVSGKVSLNPNVQWELDNYQLQLGLGVVKTNNKLKLNSTLQAKNLANGNNVKNSGNKFEPSFLVTMKFNEKGVYETTGAVQLHIQWFGSIEKQVAVILGFPIVGKVEVGVGGTGALNNIGYNIKTNSWTAPRLEIGVDGSVTLSAGVGVKKVSAGFYGKLNADGKIGSPFKMPPSFSGEASVSGEIGVYVTVDVWPVYYDGQFKVFPGKDDDWKKTIRFGGSSLMHNDTDSMFLMGGIQALPGYKGMTASNQLMNGDISFSNRSDEPNVLQKDVSASMNPVLGAAGQDVVMLYVDSDHSSPNYQHIYYRKWQGSQWSNAALINEEGLVENDPSVVSDGKEIYLAYSQVNRLFTQAELPLATDSTELYDAKLAAALGAYEIVVSKWNGNGFDIIARLTDNDVMDSAPAITLVEGRPAVAWVRNPSNTLWGAKGTSEIWLAMLDEAGNWTEMQLAKGLDDVNDLQLGMLDGRLQAAALIGNQDASLSQEGLFQVAAQDHELVLIDAQGQVMLDQGACSHPVFYRAAGKDGLAWYSQDQIVAVSAAGQSPAVLAGPETGATPVFEILSHDQKPMLIYSAASVNEQGGRDLYGIDLMQPTQPIPLTGLAEGYVDHFDCLQSSEQLYFVFRLTNARFVGDDLQVSYSLGTDAYFHQADLEILSFLYDPDSLSAGGTLHAMAEILNKGTRPMQGLYWLRNGEAIADLPVDVVLASGEACFVECALPLPGQMSGSLDIAVKSADGQTVSQPWQLSLERVAMRVLGEPMWLGDKEYVLYSLQNIGTLPCTAVFNIRLNDLEGDVIFTKQVSLDAQAVENDYVQVAKELGRTDDRILYLEVVVDQDAQANCGAMIYFPSFVE